MREISGQGPDKTLSRGFAVVRDGEGRTITSLRHTMPDQAVEIQFRDGAIGARTGKPK